MKFKKIYFVGIGIGLIILLIDIFFFFDTKWFVLILGIAVTVGWLQIWLDIFLENKKQIEVEARFLDFVRNLAGAIKSGMPVSRAIIHVSKVDYGALSPYVVKLAHQVEWSIPVRKALLLFGNSTRNDIIKRSIATVIEAEQSGGNIEDVLESITSSLIEIKKIKEERRASIHSQVVQEYLIFFIFIGVMLIVQNMLIPFLMGEGGEKSVFTGLKLGGGSTGIGSSSGFGTIGTTTSSLKPCQPVKFDSIRTFVITLTLWLTCLDGIFLSMTLIQGFFGGLIIGKLSEGDVTAGLKHSLFLTTSAFFIMMLAKTLF